MAALRVGRAEWRLRGAALLLLGLVAAAGAAPSSRRTSVAGDDTRAEDKPYRLPRSVLPRQYTLHLQPDLDSETFVGKVTIEVVAEEETDSITLHAEGLVFSEVTVTLQGGTDNLYADKIESLQYEMVHLLLNGKLIPKEKYSIVISFSGHLRDNMYGFYSSTYYSDGEMQKLAATQFQPTHARKAFPCFDEPSFKARFKVSVRAPPGYHALGNMPLEDEVASDVNVEGRTYEFKNSMLMSSYLVAFVVSKFAWREDERGDGKEIIKTWARANALSGADYSLEVSRPMLRVLEDYTDIPYTDEELDNPLNKLDQVAIPDFASGAMENWGLIAYRETALLYNGGSADAKKFVAMVISHELLHMWFGNLITTYWWDATWLNEGFARYFQYYVTDKVEPDWRMWDQFLVEEHQMVFALDALATSKALTHEVNTPTEVSAIFGSVTYNKGASILRMISYAIGAEKFKNALSQYIQKHAYGNVQPDDLFDALKDFSDAFPLGVEEFDSFLRVWTEIPGFPVVSVVRNYEQNTATISQKRFLFKGEADDRYYVPLTWEVQGGNFETSEASTYLKPTDDAIDLADMPSGDAWVIFNVQETGFYRVNYDERNWKLISTFLTNVRESIDGVHVLNRAQLLDDAFNLARANELSYDIAFGLADYLARETDYVPWSAALTGFSFLDRMLANHAQYPVFKRYVLRLVDKSYENFRSALDSNSAPDQHDKKLQINRLSTRACSLGHEKCNEMAVKTLGNYIQNNVRVDADLRSLVYCYGIRSGEDDLWDQMWNKYKESLDDVERGLIVDGLACSKSEDRLQELLQHSISGEHIRKQDASNVFTAVYSNPSGVEVALEFLDAHFDEILSYYIAKGSIHNILTGIAGRLTTDLQKEKLESVVENHADSLGATGPAALEIVEENLNWLETRVDEIFAILEDKELQQHRLPLWVTPQQYTIHLVPSLKEATFTGTETIHVTALEPTDTIILHSEGIGVVKISVQSEANNGDEDDRNDRESGDVEYDELYMSHTYETTHEFLKIYLNEPLRSESNYIISIEYNGKLRDNMYGFYLSTYTDENGEETNLAATQFQPTHARKAFPCFDEPSFKARFKVSVRAPPGYHALGNMPLAEGDDGDVNVEARTYEFQNSMDMSSYLVAIVVSKFESREDDRGDDKEIMKTWARANALDGAEYSLEVSRPMLRVLEDFTGIPYTDDELEYPLNKVDQVALPDFVAGAMENWGLITYRETALLYNGGPAAAKKRVATTIAHELLHMWFGNLITTYWWDTTWLNEGFARYFQYYITNEVESDWRMWEQFLVDQHQMVFALDALATAKALSHKVYTPAEVTASFGSITYNKGASILRMISNVIGAAEFNKALRQYIQKHAYGNVQPDDLFDALKDFSDAFPLGDEEFDSFLRVWTEIPGFPVVSVARNYQQNTATISQKRFLFKGDADDRYYVPLTWEVQGGDFETSEASTYLKPTDDTIDVSDMPSGDAWVIFNVQETGFYRVNYDERNWKLISTFLTNVRESIDGVHVLNRAQLLDDAFNLARANELSYDIAFSLSDYLVRETDYVPWAAALTGFSFLDRMLANHAQYPVFKRYVLRLVDKSYENFRSALASNSAPDQHDKKLQINRLSTQACSLGHETCNEMAVNSLSNYIQNNVRVDADLRSLVYCYGIRSGEDGLWGQMWNKYTESLDDVERGLIVDGLACSKSEARLQELLQHSISGEHIRKQDASNVFTAVYSNPSGVEVALEFLDEHFDEIRNYYGAMGSINNILTGIAGRLTTEPQKEKLESVVENHADFLGATGPAALEIVEENLNWLMTRVDEIFAVLVDKELRQYRLPLCVTPKKYTIHLVPSLEEATFTGTESIHVTAREPTDTIVLHSEGIEVVEISVQSDVNDGEELYMSHTYEKTHDFLKIYLNEPLRSESNYIISIEFNGKLRDNMYGFYLSTYTDENGREKKLAATQFQPTHAREAFPCFDEPSFKAAFAVSIQTPPGFHALGNMPISAETRRKDDSSVVTFHTTPLMSTYLIAFVVSDFVHLKEEKVEEVQFKTWARSNAIGWANYSIQISNSILKSLEDYTDIKYTDPTLEHPFDKVDQVALPDFSAGAMENWGLVTYRETALLYNDGTAAARKSIATIITHELAHMWFGNLVTTHWWDTTWLNEAFAQYFMYFITTNVMEDWRLMDQFVFDHHQGIMTSDALTSAAALSSSAYTPAQVSGRFSSITYSKGASILRMVSAMIGEKNFQDALQSYLKSNRYLATVPSDLFGHLTQKASHANLNQESFHELLLSWTEEPGFPVINVVRNYGRNYATVSQERFLLNAPATEDPRLYYIPLTWAAQGENFAISPPQQYLTNQQRSRTIENLPDQDKWVIFNVQQTGFYRVNYDATNWKLLSDHLRDHKKPLNRIHVLNRAQLLDDAFNMARAGQLPYETAFYLTDYLRRETDYVPWASALAGFSYLQRMLVYNERYERFEKYLNHLTQVQYEYYNFKDRSSHIDKLHLNRISAWSCSVGHTHCTKTATTALHAFLDDEVIVPADLRSVVYCYGVRHSTTTYWDKLLEVYKASLDSAERALIMAGLACSHNEGKLSELLQHSISDTFIRRQDASSVFTSVYSNSKGVEVALDFLDENFDAVEEYYGSMGAINNIVVGIAGRLTTEQQKAKLENFVTRHTSRLGSTGDAALETVNDNLQWLHEHEENILVLLDRHFLTFPSGGPTTIERTTVLVVLLLPLLGRLF